MPDVYVCVCVCVCGRVVEWFQHLLIDFEDIDKVKILVSQNKTSM